MSTSHNKRKKHFGENYNHLSDRNSKINSKKPLRSFGSKLRAKAFNNSDQENYRKEIIHDHLSNTLGIINILSLDNLNVDQLNHIASLKSSCDFLFDELGLPYPERLNTSAAKMEGGLENKILSNKSILLICDHPLQKKILKNLIKKWGYGIQVIKNFPKDLQLLSSMEYDLLVINHNAENITADKIQALGDIDQDFLVLTNGINTIRSKGKKFPMITGPIDPDFLNYKINKIIENRKENKMAYHSNH